MATLKWPIFLVIVTLVLQAPLSFAFSCADHAHDASSLMTAGAMAMAGMEGDCHEQMEPALPESIDPPCCADDCQCPAANLNMVTGITLSTSRPATSAPLEEMPRRLATPDFLVPTPPPIA